MNNYYEEMQRGVEQMNQYVTNNYIGNVAYEDMMDDWTNHLHDVVSSNIKFEQSIRISMKKSETKEVFSIGSFFNKVYN